MKRLAFGVAVVWASALSAAAEKPPVLDVWPGKPPGEAGQANPESDRLMKSGGRTIRIVSNVSRPTLTVFRPAKDRDTRVAVVICPGAVTTPWRGTWKARKSRTGSTPSA